MQHQLFVTSQHRELGVGHAIDAALEVLELYDAAMSKSQSDEIIIEAVGDEVVAYNRKPFPLVESLRFNSAVIYDKGKGSITLIETNFTEDGDQKTARGNLLKAAKQIPPPNDREIACVFLGSSSPTDSWDVGELALGDWEYDKATETSKRAGGGVLDPKPAEPDFEHLQAIIHFSVFTDYDINDPLGFRIVKTCELFEKPGALDEAKLDILKRAINEFIKPVGLRVKPRTG